MGKRILSIFTALMLCVSMLPLPAIAEDVKTEPTAVQKQETNASADVQKNQDVSADVQNRQNTEALPSVQSSEEITAAAGEEIAAAMIEESGEYCETFKEALSKVEEGQTIKLLKSVDDAFDVEKDITINLGDNNYRMNGNATIKNGITLTLTGKGTAGYVQSGFVNPLPGQTTEDLTGGALNIASDDVSVGFLTIEQIPNPQINFSKGTFYSIELTSNLAGKMTVNELLAEGYAFAYANNSLADGYVSRVGNVKIVEHTQHSFADGKCGCGYICEHKNGHTDGKCNDCNSQIAASIESGGVNHLYTNLQDAINAQCGGGFGINDKIVLLAAANGVLNGTGNNTFSPDDVITREQIAAIFYRYAESKGLNMTVSESWREALKMDNDYAEIADYAKTAVEWCYEHHILFTYSLDGYAYSICPKAAPTRAETATLFYNFDYELNHS